MFVAVNERPSFSSDEAETLALHYFGVSGHAQALDSERDQNFWVAGSDGAWVLKIANRNEDVSVLAFQNGVLAHLAEAAPHLAVPRLQAARDGSDIVSGPDVGDGPHRLRLLSFLPGVPLARWQPQSPALLGALGRMLGELDRALEPLSHPAMQRELQWDLKHASHVVGSNLHHITDPARRALIEGIVQAWEETAPQRAALRQSIIHGDANDFNVLVHAEATTASSPREQITLGLIDFGDMVQSYTLGEVAIAAAYALLGRADPIGAAAALVSGYHEVYPLTEAEVALLFLFIQMRLATSVTLAARQQAQVPDNAYLGISERQAWEALERLATLSPALAHYRFRAACGFAPCPQSSEIVGWLEQQQGKLAPVLGTSLSTVPLTVFDLSVGSTLLGRLPERNNLRAFTHLLWQEMERDGAEVGIGRYDEARQVYTAAQFAVAGDEQPEMRTIHIGVDLFSDAGTPIFAPLDGVVHSFQDNTEPLDYGPTIILQHETDSGLPFYTLYGHLSRSSLEGLEVGQPIARGEAIATMGQPHENGGWPPHLHFQLITDLLGREGEFPGVAPASQREVWRSLSPDPNVLLGIPERCFPDQPAQQDGASGYATGAPGPLAQPLLPPPAQDRARLDAASVRRRGARLSGRGQQRGARRALPPARRPRGAGADGGAQHQHALPARPARPLRRAPVRDPARAAERGLLCVYRQRGQRAGAAPGKDAHRRERHPGAGRGLPREQQRPGGHQPLQVRRAGGQGCAAACSHNLHARWLSWPAPLGRA